MISNQYSLPHDIIELITGHEENSQRINNIKSLLEVDPDCAPFALSTEIAVLTNDPEFPHNCLTFLDLGLKSIPLPVYSKPLPKRKFYRYYILNINLDKPVDPVVFECIFDFERKCSYHANLYYTSEEITVKTSQVVEIFDLIALYRKIKKVDLVLESLKRRFTICVLNRATQDSQEEIPEEKVEGPHDYLSRFRGHTKYKISNADKISTSTTYELFRDHIEEIDVFPSPDLKKIEILGCRFKSLRKLKLHGTHERHSKKIPEITSDEDKHLGYVRFVSIYCSYLKASNRLADSKPISFRLRNCDFPALRQLEHNECSTIETIKNCTFENLRNLELRGFSFLNLHGSKFMSLMKLSLICDKSAKQNKESRSIDLAKFEAPRLRDVVLPDFSYLKNLHLDTRGYTDLNSIEFQSIQDSECCFKISKLNHIPKQLFNYGITFGYSVSLAYQEQRDLMDRHLYIVDNLTEYKSALQVLLFFAEMNAHLPKMIPNPYVYILDRSSKEVQLLLEEYSTYSNCLNSCDLAPVRNLLMDFEVLLSGSKSHYNLSGIPLYMLSSYEVGGVQEKFAYYFTYKGKS